MCPLCFVPYTPTWLASSHKASDARMDGGVNAVATSAPDARMPIKSVGLPPPPSSLELQNGLLICSLPTLLGVPTSSAPHNSRCKAPLSLTVRRCICRLALHACVGGCVSGLVHEGEGRSDPRDLMVP